MDKSRLAEAMYAYGRVLAVADPLRLRSWVSRGLTMAQLQVLFHLFGGEGRPVGALAEIMNVRPATMTGLTDRLVKQGLTERAADPSDRRIVVVKLTEEGRRVVGEIESASKDYLRSVFERMGDEAVDRFRRALEEFIEAANEVESLDNAP
jgi:DNA-binding MarR family transcriptional regulator